MNDINVWAVLTAAISSFVLGGLWYSPALFGKAWLRESGVNEQEGHSAKIFTISFVLSMIAAFAFAIFLGPAPALADALGSALLVGLCFVTTCFGINYQFAQRSHLMWAIDGGYHSFQFLIFGLVLGLWH